MQKLPIILGIARSAGSPQASSGRESGSARLSRAPTLTPELKQSILERDDFTCRCCGFHSFRYQEIHALDRGLTNTDPANLVTTCQFCAQCFDLEQVVAMKSGFLIWLPEMDQATLNHMARAVYIARVSQGPMADAARRFLDLVMARREEARSRLQTDDPYVLSTVLRDFLTQRAYQDRGEKLAGVRLFPLDRRIVKEGDLEFNQFPQILAYWRSKDGPFGGRLPTQWLDHYKTMMRNAA